MKRMVYILISTLLLTLIGCSKINNPTYAKVDFNQSIEELVQDQPPIIKDIKFETLDGKVLQPEEGWYIIGSKIKIVVILEGNCQEVYLYITPSGSAIYKEQRLIEIINPEKNVAEYVWDVPKDTMGFLQVVAFNGNMGRRSELLNIASHK